MAITIRNKETEAMIHRIGKRRNEGPSAVVRRLAEKELAEEGKVSETESARRMRVFDELAQEFPPPEPKPTWEDVEAEMQSLFDYMEEDDSADRPASSNDSLP